MAILQSDGFGSLLAAADRARRVENRLAPGAADERSAELSNRAAERLARITAQNTLDQAQELGRQQRQNFLLAAEIDRRRSSRDGRLDLALSALGGLSGARGGSSGARSNPLADAGIQTLFSRLVNRPSAMETLNTRVEDLSTLRRKLDPWSDTGRTEALLTPAYRRFFGSQAS